MDRIVELRKQFYESIRLLQTEQDILNALPQPEYDNFFPLITGIIGFLEADLTEAKQELQQISPTDYEMKEYIESEINLILFKKQTCTSLLEKGIQDKTIEEEAEQTPQKNIIFATTESGNICLENDLKGIPEEYLEAVEILLKRLQEGLNERNPEKAKSFTTVDKKMTKIHELKDFKVRLFYKNLSSDTVYVLMVRMKKSNNDALDRKEIIDRASQRKNQFEQLKSWIKDPQKKEELVQEHAEFLNKILGHLQYNKR